MHTYREQNIKYRIKKTFPCEAVNEPICSEIARALTSGNIPEFQAVKCRCVSGNVEKRCNFSKEYIEEKMREIGIENMIKENVEADPDEEGEWR